MAHEPREQLRILFLDKKNALIADEVQQVGTVDHTPVYPREVLARAQSGTTVTVPMPMTGFLAALDAAARDPFGRDITTKVKINKAAARNEPQKRSQIKKSSPATKPKSRVTRTKKRPNQQLTASINQKHGQAVGSLDGAWCLPCLRLIASRWQMRVCSAAFRSPDARNYFRIDLKRIDFAGAAHSLASRLRPSKTHEPRYRQLRSNYACLRIWIAH